MAAPKQAYFQLTKATFKINGTEINIWPALFLHNTTYKIWPVWGDGYFNQDDIPPTAPDHITAVNKIKEIFKLDMIFQWRGKVEEGGVDVIKYGFVGACIDGSINAGYHNPNRFSGKYVPHNGVQYNLLNDAGLNRKPEVALFSDVYWANYVVFEHYCRSSFHNTTEGRGYSYTNAEQTTPILYSIAGSVGKKEAKTEVRTILRESPGYQPTPTPPDIYSGPLVQGTVLNIQGYATNEESLNPQEMRAALSITLRERIRVPFDGWTFWTNEPDYVDSPATIPNTNLFFYENDFRDLWTVDEYNPLIMPSGGGPIAYRTINLLYEPAGTRFPTPGWYYNGNVQRSIGGNTVSPIFYVAGGIDSPGEVLGYKVKEKSTAFKSILKVWVNFYLGPTNVGETPYHYAQILMKIEDNRIIKSQYPTLRIKLNLSGVITEPSHRGFQFYSALGSGNAPFYTTDYTFDTNSLTGIIVTPDVFASTSDLGIEMYHDNYNYRRVYLTQMDAEAWLGGKGMYIDTLSSNWVTRVLTSQIQIFGVGPDGFTLVDITNQFDFGIREGTIQAL